MVVHATTPALERWNVQRDNAAVDRSVIDADPQSFGRINDRRAGLPHRYLYSVEHLGGSVLKHDLVTGARTRHDAGGARRCGQFLFAPDAQRRTDEDGGWLLGLVNDDSDHTNLVVLDAADLAFPAIAAVRLPRPLPRGLHGLWSPTPL